jgi:GNAT superfamily N-acetyltransferase
MCDPIIRPATTADRPDLRRALVELQEHERRLHPTRRPGEEIADEYLRWMLARATADGAVLVAEAGGIFAGFVAGWIADDANIAETAESNRYLLISDICVLTDHRGRRLAARLLEAMERRFAPVGVTRMRITTLAANTSAVRSYAAAGFAPYEVVYEKPITP